MTRAWFSRGKVRRGDAASDEARYQKWIERYDRLHDDDRQAIGDDISTREPVAKITVVLLVRGRRADRIHETVDSLRRQLYRRWQLLVLDVSGQASLPTTLGDDPRIELDAIDPERVGGANSFLDRAAGELVAFVECGDILAESALYCLACELIDHPTVELIYSDEDRVDDGGRRYSPLFKPAWSPDLLLSFNYVGGLLACRLDRLRRIGGFRSGTRECLLYDLILRCTEDLSPDRIRHLPEVLYHRRGDGPLDSAPESYALRRDSVGTAVAAFESAPEVTLGDHPGTIRVRWPLPRPRPWVSVIIPTRNQVGVLRPCLDSLRAITEYEGFEAVVVDNQSDDPDCLAYLDSIRALPGVRVIALDAPFNYSALNNLAVRESEGEVLAFLNNDIEVVTGGWLEEMVSHAIRPRVGAVGAKLCYPDGTIQHGGVVLGGGAKTDGVAAHLNWKLERDASGYFAGAQVVRNLSAVTAACMVMRREIFDGVGGFDEIDLEVAFNDVDLCLRLRELGYWIVWTPHAELIHRESTSRGSDRSRSNRDRFAREVACMRRRWGSRLDEDPFYSPNLNLVRADCSLAFPPRRSRPWMDDDR